MTKPAHAPVATAPDAPSPSAQTALAEALEHAAGWIDIHGVHPARVVVLVPYAQLMQAARQCWIDRGTQGGFVPRFETTRNWAHAQSPFVSSGDDLAFDMARDLLTAQSLLTRAGLAAQQVALAGRLVEMALQLAPLAAAVMPAERPGWSSRAFEAVAANGESAWFALETAVARIAVAWAATSAYATDVLLEGEAIPDVDALVVLEGLQVDALTHALAARFTQRCLRLPLVDTDRHWGAVALHECSDAEDEAERAAACVLQRLQMQQTPVALVATDRALTRRIRARVAAQGAAVHDETGWKLSTTRAAAHVMSALHACARDATTDQLLDWLKTLPSIDEASLRRLEAKWRSLGLRHWSSWVDLADHGVDPQVAALRAITERIEAMRSLAAGSRDLFAWLRTLRELLQTCDLWSMLEADVAGVEVIGALHLSADPAMRLEEDSGRGVTPRRIHLGEFTSWVRDVLEAGSFVQAPAFMDAPQVVILPLHQAIGRRFASVVIPGCDDQRLPASPEPTGTWSPAQREALGLISREDAMGAQRAAWATALQAPQCDLLWRRVDSSGEAVRRSPLLQALDIDGPESSAADPRVLRRVPIQPTPRPLPRGLLLPVDVISASAYDDLRRCPYRFFGLRQLALKEADELDGELSKRDFGNWLHLVLGLFHTQLAADPLVSLDQRRPVIDAAARQATRKMALSQAEFLPFSAAWPAVREGYLRWLAEHEAGEGARFTEAESWREQRLGSLRLVGRIDRIDALPDGRSFVIDYKTESLKASQDRVRDPGEDTQLAFYAALFEDDTLRAAYVNVGERAGGTRTVEQREVVAARDALVAGMLDDFERIADGAPLPALGEGTVCEHCSARGLCRKDFWGTSRPGVSNRSSGELGSSEAGSADPRDDLASNDIADAGVADSTRAGDALDEASRQQARATDAAADSSRVDPAYRHNGRLLPRERFYEIACDPRRFVAVEACAGAGKTWMLVSRMLRALIEEGDAACEPHEILAITFTRKAAGEMRVRLDEWLERFAHCDLATLAAELQMRGLGAIAAGEAAPRLKVLRARLLQSGRPVQIRTFHGWFAGLLRHAPIAVLDRLGLPTNYQLLEDDAQARQRVWRPFFATLVDDADALADYHALVATHGRSQAAKALDEALSRRVEFVLADGVRDVADGVRHFTEADAGMAGLDSPSDWLLTDRTQRDQLSRAARALGGAAAKTFAAKGVELEQAITAMDSTGVQAALMTLAGEPRKFGEKIAGIDQVRLAQDLVQRFCAAEAQHEAWLYQQRMARLTRKLLAAFAEVKRAHRWIDMNDVEAAAHLLLSDPVLSGWLQERLDARVRHLLIDEFQDTNPMQWQALHGWLSGYAGAGGRAPSIFLVGDPKQSIYRFRRAEPQVFIAAQAFIGDVLGGDLLSCDHTHRNAPEVIRLVNGAMQAAQAQGAFGGYREHTTESRLAGRTIALPQIARESATDNALSGNDGAPGWRDSLVTPRVLPEERLIERECRQAAGWIARRIASGQAPSSVMVLARRRSRLAVMQDELRSLGIAVQQPEKNDLNDAPGVGDVVALLDALVSPGHDLSLARALRSPLFGVDDDGLVALALLQRQARASSGDASAGSSWFDLLQRDDAPPELRPMGETLLRWQAWTKALPPHDALASIFHDGDVLARFAASAPPALRDSVLTNLRGLLSAALEVDGARFATPYGLVRALRAGGLRAPAVASRDAVQLLTVHGAKGLEADVVLMLDCDTPPQRAQTMGVLVVWPGEKPVPDRFVFVASERRPSACAVDDLAAEHTARQREEINALYVATTRARSELVLSSVEPASENPLSWWSRLRTWCDTDAGIGAPPSAPSQSKAGEPDSFELREWPASMAVPPARLRTEFPVAPDTRASLFGQAMHRLLERATARQALPPQLREEVRREFGLSADELSRAAAMADRIRGGAAAWVWDDTALAWQGNEVSLHHRGRLMRIDRLVQHRETAVWWVLDHKSASRPEHDPALREQLVEYREAVQAAYPGATVQAAFLTGAGELRVVE